MRNREPQPHPEVRIDPPALAEQVVREFLTPLERSIRPTEANADDVAEIICIRAAVRGDARELARHKDRIIALVTKYASGDEDMERKMRALSDLVDRVPGAR